MKNEVCPEVEVDQSSHTKITEGGRVYTFTGTSVFPWQLIFGTMEKFRLEFSIKRHTSHPLTPTIEFENTAQLSIHYMLSIGICILHACLNL